MKWILFFLFFAGQAFSQTRVVHVFVALCDNESQGIVPVPSKIGNGNDPANNLYWGCAYGMRTYFQRSALWETVVVEKNVSDVILERAIFKHISGEIILVADAYRGTAMRQCLSDFFDSMAGRRKENITYDKGQKRIDVMNNSLSVFIGHDGLMDMQFSVYPEGVKDNKREAMIFCCYSREYFKVAVQSAGVRPLLWTTGLMSPEAYTLHEALEGWKAGEAGESIRKRAAEAYQRYQKCGLKGAMNLFRSGG